MGTKGERIITLEGITKIFTTTEVETHALSGVHLSIDEGEWISVVGPSGSGKSTLLAILGLLDTPSGGTYTLRGAPAAGLGAAELSRLRNQEIGFIFQTFNLIGDLTIYENVELPLVYRRVAPEARREKVMRALTRVGIAHRARHLPGQLSGGQRQRVAIARALLQRPALLLCDEPTGNLDREMAARTIALFSELHAEEGLTVLAVTHEERLAEVATRVIRLRDGRVEQDGRVERDGRGKQSAQVEVGS